MGNIMQLFTRQLMTAGPESEAGAWAAEMAAIVSAKMGTEVALWAAGFGAPIGAIAFTMRVEGIADLMAKAAPLGDDADYEAKLAAGADFVVGPPQDSLATPLHGDLGDPPPVGSMAVVTNAVIANGQYAEAVGWGIDVAQHVTSRDRHAGRLDDAGVRHLRSVDVDRDRGRRGRNRRVGGRQQR